MNRELKRVSVVMLIMFLALFAAATVIQVAQADSLASDSRNTRTLFESFREQRGPIMAGDTVLAQSVPVDDEYRFLRQYTNPLVYAPVTGFFTLDQGLSGIESSENSYLTGNRTAFPLQLQPSPSRNVATEPSCADWPSHACDASPFCAELTSHSSVDMYRYILRSGCRCVELDCFDGADGAALETT